MRDWGRPHSGNARTARGRQEVPQTLDVEHLLHLRPTVHLRCHALGLNGQLGLEVSRVDDGGREALELHRGLVAVEQVHAAQVLPELGLDSDLQQLVLKQDPVVLAHELIQQFIGFRDGRADVLRTWAEEGLLGGGP